MDRRGKILIPGISEAVAPVTEDELQLYDKIDFDLEEYARDVGADTLLHSCKVLAAPGPRPPAMPCPVQGSPWEGARGAGKMWYRHWKAGVTTRLGAGKFKSVQS